MPENLCEWFPSLLSHKLHYRDANSYDCYAKTKRPPDIPAGTFFVKVLERGEREGRKLLKRSFPPSPNHSSYSNTILNVWVARAPTVMRTAFSPSVLMGAFFFSVMSVRNAASIVRGSVISADCSASVR